MSWVVEGSSKKQIFFRDLNSVFFDCDWGCGSLDTNLTISLLSAADRALVSPLGSGTEIPESLTSD